MLCPEPGPGKQARSRLTLRTLPCTLSVGHLGKGGAWRERSQQAGLHPEGSAAACKDSRVSGWLGWGGSKAASVHRPPLRAPPSAQEGGRDGAALPGSRSLSGAGRRGSECETPRGAGDCWLDLRNCLGAGARMGHLAICCGKMRPCHLAPDTQTPHLGFHRMAGTGTRPSQPPTPPSARGWCSRPAGPGWAGLERRLRAIPRQVQLGVHGQEAPLLEMWRLATERPATGLGASAPYAPSYCLRLRRAGLASGPRFPSSWACLKVTV